MIRLSFKYQTNVQFYKNVYKIFQSTQNRSTEKGYLLDVRDQNLERRQKD